MTNIDLEELVYKGNVRKFPPNPPSNNNDQEDDEVQNDSEEEVKYK